MKPTYMHVTLWPNGEGAEIQYGANDICVIEKVEGGTP